MKQNSQSFIGTSAGALLGRTGAGDGATSEAPDLTADAVPGSSPDLASDVSPLGASAAALRGASSGGRGRGSGGEDAAAGRVAVRAACGIGIGGTNRSSRRAIVIFEGAAKPDAGGGTLGSTDGAACAWASAVANNKKQSEVIVERNDFTLTISSLSSLMPRSDGGTTRYQPRRRNS
jgi:hypothetical protein